MPCVSASGFNEAVSAAAKADDVVVVVGLNQDEESEGHDRTTIALPGQQDKLVEMVTCSPSCRSFPPLSSMH